MANKRPDTIEIAPKPERKRGDQEMFIWKLVSSNGADVAQSSDEYTTRSSARRAARNFVKRLVGGDQIEVKDFSES